MTAQRLHEETFAFHQETTAYAELLMSPDVLAPMRTYNHLQSDVARTIGKIAGATALVDGTSAGIRLADSLIRRADIDQSNTFSTWYTMSLPDEAPVRERLNTSSGLTSDGSAPSDEFDWTGAHMVDHIQLGNQEAHRAAYRLLDGEDSPWGLSANTRLAVKLFENDPSASLQIVLSAAQQARAHVLQHAPEDTPTSANDASEVSGLIDAIGFALTPKKSEIERMYAQTDIALRYLAQSMLKQGKLEDASQLQELLLSPFYVAELNADRVAYGLDPDGTYAEAVVEYLNVYAEDQQHHVEDIVNSLVIGGYEPFVEQYRTVLLSEEAVLHAQDISPSQLVALHESGEQGVYDQLIRLYPFAGYEQWRYPQALADIGRPDMARALRYSRFEDNPTFETGLDILFDEFDFEIYLQMRKLIPKLHEGDMQRIIGSKCTALGRLAIFIRDQRALPEETI